MNRRLHGLATWLTTLAHLRSHVLVAEALRTAGSTGYSFRVLAALDELGPTSQAALGRHAAMDRSDVTTTLDALSGAGYATRRADPADARKNLVSITPAGESELSRLDGVLEAVQEQYLAPLSPAERTTLLRLLGKLADADRTDTG